MPEGQDPENTLAGVTGELNRRIGDLAPQRGESFFTPKRLLLFVGLALGGFAVWHFLLQRKAGGTATSSAATTGGSSGNTYEVETIYNEVTKTTPPANPPHSVPPVVTPPPQPPPGHGGPPFIPPPVQYGNIGGMMDEPVGHPLGL